jgi:acyl-CoA reductase-like NAD-dependent aldehyde dehydrogenase
MHDEFAAKDFEPLPRSSPIRTFTWTEDLESSERVFLNSLMRSQMFKQGERLLRAGDRSDGCFLIDRGIVRVELDLAPTDIDTDPTIGHLGPGSTLGEMGIIDDAPRSASAFADTDVEVRWLSRQAFELLVRDHPRLGSALLAGFARDLTSRLRTMNGKVSSHVTVARAPDWINEMVTRANRAQQDFERWSEDKVMRLVTDVAHVIAQHAEELAAATVHETGLGVIEHKAAKNRFASLGVLASLEGKKAYGLLGYAEEPGVLLVANPIGVVFGLIPVTNPIATLSFKALICLKSRNAFICSIHRKAAQIGARTVDLIRDVLGRHGAPVDLIQAVGERSDRRTTMQLMQHEGIGLALATGGPSMVKAAYSSGTPAIGVGAGNAPCWVSSKANVDLAAELIVRSKSFDNGVVCGSENNLLVDESVQAAFFDALERQGAIVLSRHEVGLLLETVFEPEGRGLQRRYVGQSADQIARDAGIKRARNSAVIIAPVDRADLGSSLTQEKLAPLLSATTVRGLNDAIDIARQILVQIGGIGHTAIVHSQDDTEIRRFGEQVPASRIIVNDPGSQGCIGLTNGLTPSLTLGCGTLGGGSTTDNVSFQHLLNVRRIAYPTHEEANRTLNFNREKRLASGP